MQVQLYNLAYDLFRRSQGLLAVVPLSGFRFRHPLRHIVDAVVGLQVAEERHPVVDVVLYYQIAPAIAAFYDVLVRAGPCQCTWSL